MAYTGIFIGLVFGFAAQRGHFCIKSAFQDVQLFHDFTLLKSLLTALTVQLFGFGLLGALGWITPEAKPLYWAANVLGGLIFGIGMALAGGCAGSITYRIGEGSGMAMTAIAGYFLASAMTAVGAFSPVAGYLQSTSLILVPGGANPTLASMLDLPYPDAALGLAGLILVTWTFSLIRQGFPRNNIGMQHRFPLSKTPGTGSWSWLLTGLVVGMSGIGAFLLSPLSGRNYPLGITHGYVNLYKFTVGLRNDLTWDTTLILGMILGAGLAAFLAKEFELRLPPAKLALRTFTGGWLMGFGAVTAGGCTIGHIVSGVPLLSLGSFLTTISMFVGSWLMTWLLFHHLTRLG